MFSGPGFRANLLSPSTDEPALSALLTAAADFSLLIEGEPPAPTAARDLFTDLPPNTPPAAKYLIGLWDDANTLIGVIDLVRDYPEPGEWFIGLLLLDPSVRGHGLGESVYQALEAWIRANGAASLGLGVVEVNVRAYRFWSRVGFQETRRTPPRRFGSREWSVIYMRRLLPSPV